MGAQLVDHTGQHPEPRALLERAQSASDDLVGVFGVRGREEHGGGELSMPALAKRVKSRVPARDSAAGSTSRSLSMASTARRICKVTSDLLTTRPRNDHFRVKHRRRSDDSPVVVVDNERVSGAPHRLR